MPPAVRVGDKHVCPGHPGGPVTPRGEPTVLIGKRPAACVGDVTACQGADPIRAGEPSVLIGDRPAARVTDPTVHGGMLVEGEPTVLIGHVSSARCYREAAERGVPFIRFGGGMPTPFAREGG